MSPFQFKPIRKDWESTYGRELCCNKVWSSKLSNDDWLKSCKSEPGLTWRQSSGLTELISIAASRLFDLHRWLQLLVPYFIVWQNWRLVGLSFNWGPLLKISLPRITNQYYIMRWAAFLKMSAFAKLYIARKLVVDSGNRSTDIWHWMLLLYQLCHNLEEVLWAGKSTQKEKWKVCIWNQPIATFY